MGSIAIDSAAIGFGRRLQRLQIAGLRNMGSCSIPTAPTINRVDSVALALSSADSWQQKAGVLVQSWCAKPFRLKKQLFSEPFSQHSHMLKLRGLPTRFFGGLLNPSGVARRGIL
jgi:hypothetical protein